MMTKAYQSSSVTNQVLSASSEKLLMMLNNGLMNKIRQAQDFYQNGQTLQFFESTTKAMDFVDALMIPLDVESGDTLSINLEKVYFFIMSALFEATTTHAKSPLDSLKRAERILAPVCEGWQKLYEQKNA